MNQRLTEMLSLLGRTGEIFRLSGLSEHFQVSQRTIRNDINELNELFREKGMGALTLRRGGLIVLPEDFSAGAASVLGGDFYSYKLSPEERRSVASALLVSAAGFITLGEIADRLFVSRATIIHDLDEIKALIRAAGLEVISYPNKGLRVDGAESAKRAFLAQLLAAGGEGTELLLHEVSVSAPDRVVIQKIVSEEEHLHRSFLTDESFKRVLLHLAVMIDRSRKGEPLEKQPHGDSALYPMAQDILRYVAQYCSVQVTENDIRALAALLAKSRYLRQAAFKKGIVKIQLLTRRFISAVSEELGIGLNADYEFFENLSNHLESVFSAPPAAYAEQDIIREVLEDNAEVVEAVEKHLPIISQYAARPLTEMEVAYIAVHVCAALERKKNQEFSFRVILVCHAGIGTSKLLLEKLKKSFRFRIVDIVSAHEAKRMDAGRADFMVSTVPLEGAKLDYVIVSAQFTDRDYVRVSGKLETLRNSRQLPSHVELDEGPSARSLIEAVMPVVERVVPEKASELMRELRRVIRDSFKESVAAEAEIFSPYLHHLLPQGNIELDVECSDWRDAVRKSAQKLLERGYIEARYIDAMIRNIEENGPYIVLSQGFAVPHEGLEQGSIRVGMYLIRLKTPVPFGADELDPVEFVCCLSAVDHKMHLKAFFNLVNMLRDQEFKRLLHECKTSAQAASIIERYEYSILK